VEHDADMMRASDRIVDMGPLAGEQGGEVVFNGPLAEILQDPASLTGAYLAGRKSIAVPAVRRPADGYALRILGAAQHNLKDVDVTFPLHALVCITGVSGSGKSSLVHDVLHRGLLRALGQGGEKAGRHRAIEGVEHLSAVEMVDQSPIGRTPRSNPVTYIHVFDLIRTVFATQPHAFTV
jgi:excinuclease ABC subunit A